MTIKIEDNTKLNIRNATIKDVSAIKSVVTEIYKSSSMQGYSSDMIRGQIANFPDGQFVAIFDGKIVGYCSTFIIQEEIGLSAHTWAEITVGGFGSRHNPLGDYLYGMEVCVLPEYQGHKIGQRFYNERKKLCIEKNLKGIIFGGRIPGFISKKKIYKTPEAYLEAVKEGKIRDPIVNFQLKNDFEIIGVLTNYLQNDVQSGKFASHMVWKNPRLDHSNSPTKQKGRLPDIVRIATVQYLQKYIKSFEEFIEQVKFFVKKASDYKSDFVVFPEYFSLQLLSFQEQHLNIDQSILEVAKYTDRIISHLGEMAVHFNINIIGGSLPKNDKDGKLKNIAYVLLRDGSVYTQEKIHITPDEKTKWKIKGGDTVSAIPTDCGMIGVLICYDVEFPELSRYLIAQGAIILFVPFSTDERLSYLRVRYCAQARAVENQCYVVMSGNVGHIPSVPNMDIHYAQSCILTPCDFYFTRDGISAEATPNTEMILFADLRYVNLNTARNSGSVQNLKDRRFDLYSSTWLKF